MMKKVMTESIKLTHEGVYLTSEKIDAILADTTIDEKEVLHLKLLAEETLLKYKDKFGEGVEVSLRYSEFLGTAKLTLCIKCDSLDPFEEAEDSVSALMRSMLINTKRIDELWRYRNGVNYVRFTAVLEKKLGQLTRIMIGILCGFGGGLIINAFLPSHSSMIAEKILIPLTNTFTGLLCVMATVMCFGAICLGIVRTGDISTFSTTGRKIIKSFLIVSFVLTLLNTAWIVPGMTFSSKSLILFNFFDIFDILLSFVPNSILSPFLEFNSVHIIIIGAMFGIAMLHMGPKADRLTEVIDEINLVAVLTNTYINRFIAIYVGLMVCTHIITGQYEVMRGFLKLLVMIAAGELVIMAVYTLIISAKLKVKALLYVRKLMPQFMISLTSASVGAAFSTSIATLVEALGIEVSFAPLTYNLGVVLFRPGYCIVFTSCSLFAADQYGVEVTWGWLLAAFLMSFVLSVATPPTIGGTTVCFSILFSQLGIGEQALSMIISVNAILEFMTVAVNNYCLDSQIVLLSDSLGKIDRSKLRKA